MNTLAARRRCYTVSMTSGEKVLSYLNLVMKLATKLKSMGVEADEKEISTDVINGLPLKFEGLIVALDALGKE